MATFDNEEYVLCASSKYTQQYYFNENFKSLPQTIQDELKIMCVLFTEDVGGTLTLQFDENYNLMFKTFRSDDDFAYDEIGAELKIKQIRNQKRELLESLELYFKTVYLKEEM